MAWVDEMLFKTNNAKNLEIHNTATCSMPDLLRIFSFCSLHSFVNLVWALLV